MGLLETWLPSHLVHNTYLCFLELSCLKQKITYINKIIKWNRIRLETLRVVFLQSHSSDAFLAALSLRAIDDLAWWHWPLTFDPSSWPRYPSTLPTCWVSGPYVCQLSFDIETDRMTDNVKTITPVADVGCKNRVAIWKFSPSHYVKCTGKFIFFQDIHYHCIINNTL